MSIHVHFVQELDTTSLVHQRVAAATLENQNPIDFHIRSNKVHDLLHGTGRRSTNKMPFQQVLHQPKTDRLSGYKNRNRLIK